MKHLYPILSAVVMLVSASLVSAQGTTGGFKLGINLADMHGEDVEDWGQQSRMGLCVGGFVGFGLGNMVMIQPELLYSQKGIEDEEGGVEAAIKLDYIDIPIALKLIVPARGNVQPFLSAGPYFAYNVNAEVKAGAMELDLSDEVNDLDFGAVFGGGLGFALPKGRIIFDVRYGLGLISIDEANGEAADVKNDAFSFTLGYAF